jgi:Amidohydrolase family
MHVLNDTLQSIPSIRRPSLPLFFPLLSVLFHSAITHGISHVVGQIAVGQLADLVLWKFENFGAKAEMVLKSGVIVWAQVPS